MTMLKPFGLAFLAFAAFSLAACDAIAKLGDPTFQSVLQADMERAAEKAGEGETAEDVVKASMAIVESRLDAAGIITHEISYLGEGRVVIRTSGDNPGEQVRNAATTRGELVMRMVDENATFDQLEMGIAPPGSEVLETRDGFQRLAVKRVGGIRGDRIAMARAGSDQMTNEPIVSITFDEQGGRDFAILSTDNVGRQFAIILDDEVLSAPIFAEPILGGQAQISGGFTYEEAERYAILLQSGELPVTFTVLEERTLGE